ncbi:MAG: sulfurtransferase TusA [Pseudomonadota bacterium]
MSPLGQECGDDAKRGRAAVTERLDARGLTCPEPLMLARNAMRMLAPGETLEILATDPSTVRDFDQFCRFMGHDMLDQSRDDSAGEWRFLLRKGG